MDAIIKLSYTDVQPLLWNASRGHLALLPGIGSTLALGWQPVSSLEWASHLYSRIWEHICNYRLIPTSSKRANIYWALTESQVRSN